METVVIDGAVAQELLERLRKVAPRRYTQLLMRLRTVVTAEEAADAARVALSNDGRATRA